MEEMNARWKKIHQLQRGEWLLKRLCGSATRAKVIWEVGLPNILEFCAALEKVLPATEQQQVFPCTEQQRSFEWVSILFSNTTPDSILNWLSRLADSIQEHKATLFYQEHARKSGTEKTHRPPMEDMNAAWKQIAQLQRAEAVLRMLCGSAMMAKVIWQVGLPNILEAGFAMEKVLPATEQQQVLPATEQQRPFEWVSILAENTTTDAILNSLSRLADSIQEHKATLFYQEHARKSGNQKNKSGLTEIELKMKEEKNRARELKYGRQPSTASGSNTWQAPAHWQWHAHTWEAPAQWQWHGHTWKSQWQWH